MEGHVGSDGSQMDARIERHGEWNGNIGENVIYEFADAMEAVVNWLIDDGCPDRGHRNNILGSQFKVCGVGTGPHSEMENIATVVFATECSSSGSAAPSVPGPPPAPKKAAEPEESKQPSEPKKPGELSAAAKARLSSGFGFQSGEERKDCPDSDDEEMPYGAVSAETEIEEITQGKKKIINKKITYTFEDGSKEVRERTKETTA